MTRRAVAVFINRAAATRAGQASVQDTDNRFTVVPRMDRGAIYGYSVVLRKKYATDDEITTYIME